MKKPSYINIADACHENWNTMSPADQGRFCGSCCKTVTDFSTMTDKEILQILSKAAGNSCGRFTSDQLQRPMFEELPVRSKPYKFFLSAIIPTFLLANIGMAQKNSSTKKTKGEVERMVLGKPARVAECKTKDTTIGAPLMVEHFLGEISIMDAPVKQDTSVKGIGTIKMDIKKIETNVLPVNTENIMMGGIQIFEKVTIVDTVKTYVRKALNQNGFKILGNPAAAGSQINLQFKNEGRYFVQLLDASGKLILSTSITVISKNAAGRVILPNSFIPGTYFIKVTDSNKKSYTDKVNIY